MRGKENCNYQVFNRFFLIKVKRNHIFWLTKFQNQSLKQLYSSPIWKIKSIFFLFHLWRTKQKKRNKIVIVVKKKKKIFLIITHFWKWPIILLQLHACICLCLVHMTITPCQYLKNNRLLHFDRMVRAEKTLLGFSKKMKEREDRS